MLSIVLSIFYSCFPLKSQTGKKIWAEKTMMKLDHRMPGFLLEKSKLWWPCEEIIDTLREHTYEVQLKADTATIERIDTIDCPKKGAKVPVKLRDRYITILKDSNTTIYINTKLIDHRQVSADSLAVEQEKLKTKKASKKVTVWSTIAILVFVLLAISIVINVYLLKRNTSIVKQLV